MSLTADIKPSGYIYDDIPHITRMHHTQYTLDSISQNIRIYLINLDRRPDRLARCEEQLRRLNLSFSRYPAIDGEILRNHVIDEIPILHPETNYDFFEGMRHSKFNCVRNYPASCGAVGSQGYRYY